MGQNIRTILFLKIFMCLTFFAPALALSHNETLYKHGPSLHLNENYDTNALIISALNYDKDTFSKILVPILSDENTPQIIIFDRDGKTDYIRENLTDSLKKKWSNYVTVFDDAVIWSQDFLESFNNNPLYFFAPAPTWLKSLKSLESAASELANLAEVDCKLTDCNNCFKLA